jgi:hypothetical protein
MKAAVLHEVGGIPRYEDFPDPVAGEGEVIIDVKAVAVENVDKMIAVGTHYTSGQFTTRLPMIPAFDGVGTLPDGTLVGFGASRQPYGALAEKTVVPGSACAPVPGGVDPAVATVLATAITGMSLKTAAGFVPGETRRRADRGHRPRRRPTARSPGHRRRNGDQHRSLGRGAGAAATSPSPPPPRRSCATVTQSPNR